MKATRFIALYCKSVNVNEVSKNTLKFPKKELSYRTQIINKIHKLSTVTIEKLSIYNKNECNCQRKNNCPVSGKCQTTKTLYKYIYAFSTNKWK